MLSMLNCHYFTWVYLIFQKPLSTHLAASNFIVIFAVMLCGLFKADENDNCQICVVNQKRFYKQLGQ